MCGGNEKWLTGAARDDLPSAPGRQAGRQALLIREQPASRSARFKGMVSRPGGPDRLVMSARNGEM